jgi:hypothetical protein
MILRLLCIWLVFYSLLSLLMHGTMNLKVSCTLGRFAATIASPYSAYSQLLSVFGSCLFLFEKWTCFVAFTGDPLNVDIIYKDHMK